MWHHCVKFLLQSISTEPLLCLWPVLSLKHSHWKRFIVVPWCFLKPGDCIVSFFLKRSTQILEINNLKANRHFCSCFLWWSGPVSAATTFSCFTLNFSHLMPAFGHILAPRCSLRQHGSESSRINISPILHMHKRLPKANLQGVQSCATYQMKKGGCWRKAGQWETPRPHWSRPDAKWSQHSLPFFSPFLFQTGRPHSKWMDALKFPPVLGRGENSNPPACSHTGRALPFQAHHSPVFNGYYYKGNALSPTFKSGKLRGFSEATIAPMRVLNFPTVSKRKKKKKRGDHRVLSTIVWGNRRSPAPRSLPAPSPR